MSDVFSNDLRIWLMSVEAYCAILEIVSQSTRLTDVQELVFRQCWQGKTYSEIAEHAGYDVGYIKGVGYRLWKLLSKNLGEKVTKSSVQAVLRRHLQQIQASPAAFSASSMGSSIAQDSNLNHQPITNRPAANLNVVKSAPRFEEIKQEITSSHHDLSEADDVSVFHGRTQELSTLKQWIIEERCRLIALLGVGGIGKTSLSVKLAESLQDRFEFLIWRSLRNAPSVHDLLGDLIQFLAIHQEAEIPDNEDLRISCLLNYLRQHRCLLVLDNVETILRSGERAGTYLERYEGYSKLIQRVGELSHQSCLVLTSREKCKELIPMEGNMLPVRSLQLAGLHETEARELFSAKGTFYGSDSEWKYLIQHYGGNPLALKIVADGIHDLLNGNVSKFLELLNQGMFTFDDIRDLLDQQFFRLSSLETEVMYWLAIEREPVSFIELRENIVSLASQQELSNTLRSLGQRSLIEKRGNGFTQQPVVMEYITERLIETICREITIKEVDVLNRHALIKAEAKDHIKNTQILLILKRVIHKLLTVSNQESIRQQLIEILSVLRSRSNKEHSISSKDRKSVQIEGYAGSNILNLLNQLQTNASDYGVSNLLVWQAYLQGLNLAGVKPTNINLAESVFTQSFGAIFAVDFSPDGNLFVIGGTNGEISLWRVADSHPLSVWKGHVKQVQSVAWSPDGTLLATGGADCTIKLWEVQSGQVVRTLQGHTNKICTIAWSPDGTMLATGSADKTFRIWNTGTGDCLKLFVSEEPYEETNSTDTTILTEIQHSNETTLEAADINHQ
jgi:hypothetical protein